MSARPRQGARIDATTWVALAVPVLVVLLALLVHADPQAEPASRPAESPLDRATLVCPPGGQTVSVGSVSGASGTVTVRRGQRTSEVEVAPGRTASVEAGDEAVVVSAVDDLAPGLVAGRFGSPLAGVDCRPPVTEQWFTGVGAGAKHRSLLQLVNPDAGRSVVDVEVLGRRGVVDAPALRGLAVRGGETRVLDLAEVLPRRDDLALHVRTVRGRISASVRDRYAELGNGQSGEDSLASQAEPATTNLLLGLPGGAGQRTLVLANPGDDEGRATVRLVTADSVFTPDDADEVRLPPRSVVRVPLARVLKGAGNRDDERPLGLQVESTVPATAGLVMFVEGDLAHAVPLPPLEGPATTPLPEAAHQLVLGAADGPGVVTVRLWDSRGRELEAQRVELGRGRGAQVDLPGRARLLTVEPERASVTAVVLSTDGAGATLLRLREPVTTGLVADVAPGLPSTP